MMQIYLADRIAKREVTKKRCDVLNVRTRKAFEIRVCVHDQIARKAVFIDSFQEHNIFCNNERIRVEVFPTRVKR